MNAPGSAVFAAKLNFKGWTRLSPEGPKKELTRVVTMFVRRYPGTECLTTQTNRIPRPKS